MNQKPEINLLTVGHRRLLARMGFPCFMQTEAALDAWDGMTEDERGEAVVAAVWLSMQPLDDVKPGGKINSMISSDTWKRTFEAWEFGVTPEELDRDFPGYFRKACGREEAHPLAALKFDEAAATEAAQVAKQTEIQEAAMARLEVDELASIPQVSADPVEACESCQ